ncbi:uncharacterized protein V1513DRAFT_480414 [Lipomyces chichibuensis]|uniref:uncharacterized protein n=1 Tax=Lipomyces chichibuensis TaxID=1546026 RepID=UPI00334355F6
MTIIRSTWLLGPNRQIFLQSRCRNYQLVIAKMHSISKCTGHDNRTAVRWYSQSSSDGDPLSGSAGEPTNGQDRRQGRQSRKGKASSQSTSVSVDSASEMISQMDATSFAMRIESSDPLSSASEFKASQAERKPVRISPEQRDKIGKNLEKAVQNTQEIRSLTKPRIIASVTANRVRSLLELLFSSPQPAQKRVLPTYNALERKEVVTRSSDTDVDDASYFPELEKLVEDNRASEEFPHHQNQDVTTSTSRHYGFIDVERKASLPQEINQPTRALFVDVSVPTLQKSDFVRLIGIDPGCGTNDERKRAREFLDYLDFEFKQKRENLNRRRGYYLRFKTVEAAELYQKRTSSVILYGKQMKDRTRFVSVGVDRRDFRLKMIENSVGRRSGGRYVLLHDLPLSVAPEEVHRRLSEFALDGEPSEAIRSLSSQTSRSRYLVRVVSEDEAFKVVLKLQGMPWFDNGFEGIFVEVID